MVNINFQRKSYVSRVCIYVDFEQDESYTPKRFSVRAGYCFNSLTEVQVVSVEQPTGWVDIPLHAVNVSGIKMPLKTFAL